MNRRYFLIHKASETLSAHIQKDENFLRNHKNDGKIETNQPKHTIK